MKFNPNQTVYMYLADEWWSFTLLRPATHDDLVGLTWPNPEECWIGTPDDRDRWAPIQYLEEHHLLTEEEYAQILLTQ